MGKGNVFFLSEQVGLAVPFYLPHAPTDFVALKINKSKLKANLVKAH